MDPTETRDRRFRLRFRLSTIFWIMLSIAAFLAGRHWHYIDRLNARGEAHISIGTGCYTTITTSVPISKLFVDDPTAAKITPLGDKQIQVLGVSPGRFSLYVWNKEDEISRYSVVVGP
jgi:Flp pilus assembly secretin CpaC